MAGSAFTAAIVGRPNVGKSTLFNRLVGKRLALVDDRPGVTRDRREGEAHLGDLEFRVIDTAGLEEAAAASLEARMRRQTQAAIEEADLVLFLVDARAGITPADEHFAGIVRSSGKPVILIANKAEGRGGAQAALEGYALGLGDPLPLSAEHGEGLGDLYDALAAHAPVPPEDGEEADEGEGEEAESTGPLRIAVVGRPNAGKSTLVNRMLGEDRLLTGPEAGITRDSIAVEWTWRGRPVRVFDTAGLRKKARIDEKLEKLSVADALRAVRFAEVVIVLTDAAQPFEKQDLTIIDLIEREGRALVVGLNKWDLVAGKPGKQKALAERFERLLPQVRGAPLVPVSGLSGRGVETLMEGVIRAHEVWNTRISTGRLNRWLAGVLEAHPPPAVAGRRIKLRYLTQVKSRPPTFALFGNQLGDLPRSYTRYLVNGLREAFELPGTPIRLMLRTGENPYDKE